MRNLVRPLVVAASIFASGAQAATVYTSQAAFDAAGSGPVATEDFSSVTDDDFFPDTIGDYSFSSSVAAWNGNESQDVGNVNGTSWIQYRLGTATLTSSASFTLLGFDMRAYKGDEGTIVGFTANTGETGTFVLPVSGFLGFGFDTAVTSITFRRTISGSFFGSDNYRRYAATAAIDGGVPEPATWAMMMVGFGLMGGAVRFPRRPATVAFA